MRLFIKILIIAVLAGGVYYYYGQEIDTLAHRAKDNLFSLFGLEAEKEDKPKQYRTIPRRED